MSIPGAASPLLLASAADEEFSIERSLRFNSDDSPYLNFTPSSAGNRRTWTWSGWVKLLSGDRKILFCQTTNEANEFFVFEHRFNNLEMWDYTAGVYHSYLATNAVFRDYSAWYHIVITYDTTNATADDRHRIYVNGEQITSFSSRTNPSQNFQGHVNTTSVHYLSGYTTTGTLPHNGYYAEVHFIDGQSLAASDFGEYDDNNVWQPKAYSGSYGTNGWYLNFSDATNTTTIAEDSSGNGNDWTANNISVTAGSGNDSLFDSPTNGTQSDTGAGGEVSGNYCTFNQLSTPSIVTLSDGGLQYASSDQSWAATALGGFGMAAGKWYWECTIDKNVYIYVGIAQIGKNYSNTNIGSDSTSSAYYTVNGNFYGGGAQTASSPTSYTTNATLMFAYDADAKKFWVGQNGTWFSVGGNAGDPANGNYPAFTGFGSNDEVYTPAISTNAYSVGTITAKYNFGQRPYSYTAPSGFKALCTANLDDPTIADGSTGMDVALYTGNSSTQTISGLNMSPDLVWIKSRSQSRDHKLVDSVRGVGEELESNTTAVEATNSDGLTAFNSDGFSLGADNDYNIGSGNTYAAWAWDAGSSTASNTDGTITTNVRANASTGFSIVSWTGTSSSPFLGHGLNAAPEFIIAKNRDRAANWSVYHVSLTSTYYLRLNTGDSQLTSSGVFFNGTPSSSTFRVGSALAINYSGEEIIAYCWAPVEGYSAFGSYTGNQNADGPFVYTGFRPRWIMIKRSDSGDNWVILDAEREGYNVDNDALYANGTNIELTSDLLDIVSNGFKLRTTDGMVNSSGGTYIYAAFAEHPFKTARAR